MRGHELQFVKRRPTHWSWVFVALYNALGHALAMHRPPTFLPYMGIGQLTKQFEAVGEKHPEMLVLRDAVEEVERLRTTYIAWTVGRWPEKLGEIVTACGRVIQVLGPKQTPYGPEPDSEPKGEQE